jgi:hypothetical protein
MGQYSKFLHEKTEDEINEIFNSISTYSGEFIDDFFNELDIRRMLWDMKIFLNERDLITITMKLEGISNSKYLNLLKRELKIRGLSEKYQREKNGFTNKETEKSFFNNESILTSIGKYVGGLVLIVFLIKKFIFSSDIDSKEKEYHPINQPKQQSFDVNLQQQTKTPVAPKFEKIPPTEATYKLDLEKYQKPDPNSLRLLQDISSKSSKPDDNQSEKITYHDLKNQINHSKPNSFESNPFSKRNREQSSIKSMSETLGNNKIENNGKQTPN